MNVPVQDRNRSETFQISQSPFAVACTPTPLRINRPQRDMSENNDGGARTKVFQIGLEPFELIISELPQATGLEIQDVDEANEMAAVLVEAVPTRALRFDALQIAFTVKLPAVIQHIMLTWNEEDVFRSAALQDLIESVELLRLRQLGDVSCVNEKRRRRRHRVDAVECNLKRFGHIFVRVFAEADMTVADLQKAQISGGRQRISGLGDLRQGLRYEDAATDRPKHAGAGPCHAFEKAAAIDSVVFVVVRNVIRHNFLFGFGLQVASICLYRFGWILFRESSVSEQDRGNLLQFLLCGCYFSAITFAKNAALGYWPKARRPTWLPKFNHRLLSVRHLPCAQESSIDPGTPGVDL